MKYLLFFAIAVMSASCSEDAEMEVVPVTEDTLTVVQEEIDVNDLDMDDLPPSDRNDFMTRFSLDSSWRMGRLDSLIGAYQQKTPAERIAFRTNLDDQTANELIAYAYHTAVEGVRFQNKKILKDGITALSIENARYDFKSTLVGISLLEHSAGIIDMSDSALYSSIYYQEAAQLQQLVNRFHERDSAQQRPSTFGYYEIRTGSDGNNMDYVYKPLIIVSDSISESNSDSI